MQISTNRCRSVHIDASQYISMQVSTYIDNTTWQSIIETCRMSCKLKATKICTYIPTREDVMVVYVIVFAWIHCWPSDTYSIWLKSWLIPVTDCIYIFTNIIRVNHLAIERIHLPDSLYKSWTSAYTWNIFNLINSTMLYSVWCQVKVSNLYLSYANTNVFSFFIFCNCASKSYCVKNSNSFYP